MGSKERITEAHWLLGEAYLGLNQLDAAQTSAEQSVNIASGIGRRLFEGNALRTLGNIARRKNDWNAAEEYLQRSIAVLDAAKNRFELAKSQFHLALLRRDTERPADARALLEQALSTFTQLGAEADRARALTELEQLKACEGSS
jgi:tetratricopeptide (TPR) repeat protein